MKYTLKNVPKMDCPYCEKKVLWLSPEDLAMVALPSFFICFKCPFIGQVGEGKVKIPEREEVIVVTNMAECNACGYRDHSEIFPVEPIEDLQGQIHCPQCGSSDVEM